MKNEELLTWVEKRPKLKKGSIVTLKEYPDKQWTVVDIYYSCDHKYLHTDWKVGGLV